ncbi:MAG: hypothetical protein R8G01_20275 [Ilumatobacteraceae bacterium]|nr:hypothetical protein [Ilumatobacteraceae bacterium]
MTRIPTRIALLTAAGLLVAACGGGDDDTSVEPAEPAEATADETAADSSADAPNTSDEGSGADTATDEPAADTTDAPSGTYDAGDIEFRAVNLLDEPVDVYVRTTGLLEGFEIQTGLAPGATSDFAAPPEGGSYVITTAGAGDPTCVVDCDHLIAVLTGYPEDGPVHTVVLYDDEFSGPSAMDLWEQPVDRRGNGNEMPLPEPGLETAVVTAIAVGDTDFGLRLSIDGTPGCVDPIGGGSILIGGNQTLPFDLTGVSSFSIHSNDDQECAEPTDGPFAFDAAAGERVHILLHGSAAGDLAAVILPMSGDAVSGGTDAGSTDSGEDAGVGDRDLAVDLMSTEVATTFGLDAASATCVAELIVDALGADVLVDDGGLVELDSLDDAAADATGAALVASTETCGVDPAAFGG